MLLRNIIINTSKKLLYIRILNSTNENRGTEEIHFYWGGEGKGKEKNKILHCSMSNLRCCTI